MLLSCRLRWYVLETSRALRRHWQALCLSVFLLLPAMPVFAQSRILGAPVLAALAPTHSVEWRFVWVHLLEAAAVLWVLMQRSAITGGPFAGYLKSLPTSEGRRRAVDVAVVSLANTPLLLTVLAAAVAVAFLPNRGANYLFILALTFITLGLQLAALARNARHVGILFLANGVLVGAAQFDHPLRPVLLAVPLLLALFVLARPAAAMSPAHARRRLRPHVPAGVARMAARFAPPPLALLEAGILRYRSAKVFARVVIMSALTGCTAALFHLWDFDVRAVPLTLISHAALALIVATTFRDLRAAHVRAAHFMRSLPLPRATLTVADLLTVGVLWLPFAAVAPWLLSAHGIISAWTAVAIVACGAPLLVLLYAPQRFAPRQSVLLGTILATLWVIGTWQFFV